MFMSLTSVSNIVVTDSQLFALRTYVQLRVKQIKDLGRKRLQCMTIRRNQRFVFLDHVAAAH